jgi:ABC-type glycerol-3-phosphate transport system substrate-binding protein
MKKTIKKLTAVGLTLTSVMGLVACGASSSNSGSKEKKTVDWASVEKPGTFKVMADGTVVKDTNGADAFYAQLKELTGLDIEWVRPEHSAYYDQVASTFASGDLPDVVLLSSDYLALYANNGYLWDMTDAWEKSETKNSGRLITSADKIEAANVVLGADGEEAMYGFSPFRGNGCCTYVKTSWLEKAGLSEADVKDKTLTYSEYYDILKKMKAASSSDYVISAPGWIGTEAPYTNYLPEFYQDAEYTFYLKGDEYVDGFAQDEMKAALQRLQDAVKDGIIDPSTEGQTTAQARNKFYSTDPSTESGVFTYWAGTWADTLKTNLANKKLDDRLVAIYPIKELGSYTERLSTAWCITSAAEQSGKAEGIFKYFIDTMLDGGDVQMLWQYGAKGTHWDDKAETVTLQTAKAGDAVKSYTYEEGKFHFLPSPEDPTALMKKNHIDPVLAIATFKGEDPGASSLTDVVKDNFEMFSNHSDVAKPLPMTETLGNNITDINKARNEVISKVALGTWSVDEAMKYYHDTVDSKADAVIKSLNDLLK